MFRLLAAFWLPLLVPASAQGHGWHYVDGGGDVWHYRENSHGAVLRRGRVLIYLGRGCDVVSPQLGRGRWGWANGGVIFTAGARRLGFPRHDPPVRRAAAQCDVEDVPDFPPY
jgi:hypothetical protein